MKWISVKDRLPEKTGTVYLVSLKSGTENEVAIAKMHFNLMELDREAFYCPISHYEYSNVTHWMKLPKPPEE